MLPGPFKNVGSPQQIIKPGSRWMSGFSQFHFELVRPYQQRTPDELISRQDHGQHRNDRPKGRPVIAGTYRSRHERTQAWQLNIFAKYRNRLAGTHGEPPRAERHHAIPDQAMHRGRHFERLETLPSSEPVVGRRLVQILRNGYHRVIEPEGHVPDLSSKDGYNAGALYSEQTSREKRDEKCHEYREKTEHRDGLHDAQKWKNDRASEFILRGQVADQKCKDQRKAKRNPHPEQGSANVVRDMPDMGRYRQGLRGAVEMHHHPGSKLENAPK